MTHFHCLLPAVIFARSGESWAWIGSNTKDAINTHVDSDDKRIIQRSEIATIENHIPKSAFPVNFVPADAPF